MGESQYQTWPAAAPHIDTYILRAYYIQVPRLMPLRAAGSGTDLEPVQTESWRYSPSASVYSDRGAIKSMIWVPGWSSCAQLRGFNSRGPEPNYTTYIGVS